MHDETVTVRVHNGDQHPFTVAEANRLVGQDAKITGPRDDWTHPLGHAHVDAAAIDGTDIVLNLTVNTVTPDPFGEGSPDGVRRAGIGFTRDVDGITLRTVCPDQPPVAATITGSQIRTGSITPIVDKYATEHECERRGGHCWEREDYVMPSAPPQFPERCKHCPATRVATPRHPFSYRYPDGRQEG